MTVFPTPQAHIQRWLQRSILRVAACLGSVGGDPVLEDYGFLGGYLDPLKAQFPDLTAWKEVDRAFQAVVAQEDAAAQHQDFPLMRLRRAGLTPDHLQALLYAGLVEVDARFGVIYSVLHPLPEEQRLTIGLLEDLIRFNTVSDPPPAWVLAQDLERFGLVTRHHSDRPRASQALTVPAPVWDALCGAATAEPLLGRTAQPADGLIYHPPESLNSFESLTGLLPQDLLDLLARLPDLVSRDLTRGVILRGMRGAGRQRALAAMAHSINHGLLHLKRSDPKALPALCRLAGALAILQRAIPIIDLELAPGENLALPSLAGYSGLFGVFLNREGSLSGAQVEGCLTLWAPAPDRAARQRQWSQILDPSVNGAREMIAQVSQDYHLTLGTVEQAGRLAHAYAALNNHPYVELTDVQEAYCSLNQQTLENLATRISMNCTWDTLIVADSTRAELETLISRCRYRETLLGHLGPGFTGATRGVRALFGGCSGTGKTLAARIIAAELGLDLYRVDLSAVVSKYIGETERNLSRLFARAEEQDIILLLDEGDSLLTARTDVRSSNDRYANLETNYLLQRLEQYEGIILITTNASDRIDSAFQRRIDVVIDFRTPDAGERERLWRLHLPEQHAVSKTLLRQAALRCQLTGGQIRNAALHATLLAVEADASVSDCFLTAGIQREYTKMGAVAPLK
ncbi:MAG: ATP-binding protein [Leptolyngbyaceae cyanobacterium MO_188.B28]|nr:ATP-binding protein [Leptolyngbyaceae cyanobacterium MO_188.B28]